MRALNNAHGSSSSFGFVEFVRGVDSFPPAHREALRVPTEVDGPSCPPPTAPPPGPVSAPPTIDGAACARGRTERAAAAVAEKVARSLARDPPTPCGQEVRIPVQEEEVGGKWVGGGLVKGAGVEVGGGEGGLVKGAGWRWVGGRCVQNPDSVPTRLGGAGGGEEDEEVVLVVGKRRRWWWGVGGVGSRRPPRGRNAVPESSASRRNSVARC
ncbi:unnamed protein product [Lampetra planeri]